MKKPPSNGKFFVKSEPYVPPFGGSGAPTPRKTTPNMPPMPVPPGEPNQTAYSRITSPKKAAPPKARSAKPMIPPKAPLAPMPMGGLLPQKPAAKARGRKY